MVGKTVFGPRHWANVPGVRYPENVVSGRAEQLSDEEALCRTHCPTREIADQLGLNCDRARKWLDKCGVPRVSRMASFRRGSLCFFWERKAAAKAVRKYKAL